ncbi:hypothetical protein [Hymenobacter pini]|uniref:hypothetical protein n=1 Tax=Hymenobacter pini TaxID=2880879 RepID=UPI001CF271CA|nr:hypothetical protein [Hymenobacter pini]MCA8830179.1 hypothetical protein [Hymenobacter pini]
MTGQKLILLKQVLEQMQTAKEPFSLRFVKLNEGKQEGGEVVFYDAVRLSSRAQPEGGASAVEGEGASERADDMHQKTAAKGTRAPNHSDHMTRNLVNTRNGRFLKVHIYLLLEFNGKKVLL